MNVFADDWDAEQARPGYSWKRMRLGRRLGGDLLGASVFELPPGEKSFPYHLHHGNEELLVVLAGTPTLRTPEGERALAPGDAALFRRGPDGAHQLRNDSREPARYLMVSSMISPEITEYPDSGKVGALAAPPGRTDGAPLVAYVFRENATVEYFEGE